MASTASASWRAYMCVFVWASPQAVSNVWSSRSDHLPSSSPSSASFITLQSLPYPSLSVPMPYKITRKFMAATRQIARKIFYTNTLQLNIVQHNNVNAHLFLAMASHPYRILSCLMRNYRRFLFFRSIVLFVICVSSYFIFRVFLVSVRLFLNMCESYNIAIVLFVCKGWILAKWQGWRGVTPKYDAIMRKFVP